MRALLLCVLACAAVVSVGEEAKPKKQRLALLEEMALQSSVFPLTGKAYQRFVHKGPRPYHVVVLAGPYNQQRYGGLKQVIRALEEVGNSYQAHLASHRAATKPTAARDVVFVAVDTDEDPSILAQHGLEGTVVMFCLPPVEDRTTDPLAVLPSMMYNFRSAWTPASLHKWVTQQTKIRFELQVSVQQRFGVYAVMAVVLVVALLMARPLLPYLYGPSHWQFWFGLCATVYLCVVSGMHYCVLRDAMPFGIHPRTQSVLLFHPSPNAQFALEGVLFNAVQLLAATMLVGLVEYYPTLPNGHDKRFAGALLAGLFFLFVLLARYLFFVKQHWV